MGDAKKPLVALLVAAESSPSVLYGLYDVLYSVGMVYPDMTVGEPGPELLDVRIVASDTLPFRCIGNVLIEPHCSLNDLQRVDVVVVCDLYTPIHQPPHGRHMPELAWVRKMHGAGALVCAVCTGSLLLAEAGLMDGRETASHWAYAELFRSAYPMVRMRRESVLCLTEEADRIVTAGSATAWQDLATYLIARLCGRRHAWHAARVFLLAAHEEGQLPFAGLVRRVDTTDGVIADCQAWAAKNYALANPVQHMVQRSGLHPRTFARRFRRATGHAAIQYIQALRIDEARQLLESSDLPSEAVGLAVGYDDPASFRRLFKRIAGLSPAAYRRRSSGWPRLPNR